jgi:hypothetical protein
MRAARLVPLFHYLDLFDFIAVMTNTSAYFMPNPGLINNPIINNLLWILAVSMWK